jgi:UDP-MurNAc hydroxylase
MPKDLPVIYLDHGGNFLRRMLQDLGFTNLVGIQDDAETRVGPFALTMYAPFEKHIAGPITHESVVGNLIDSALFISAGGYSVLNTNDNTPGIESAKRLRARHGRVTVAQLTYNAAGPFPSCFDNLTEQGKLAAHHRIIEQNLNHLECLARILEPEYVMPFAGPHVVGGRQWRKNRFLGTTIGDEAAAFLMAQVPSVKPLLLREGQTFDCTEGRIINGEYQPIDLAAQNQYVETVLSRKRYPFESLPVPASEWLRDSLPIARTNLWEYQQRYELFPDLNLSIALPDGRFQFNWKKPTSSFCEALQEPYLAASLDARLLGQILRREEDWNNAEVGCHVDFVRAPDVHLPDVHTLLSFFHL